MNEKAEKAKQDLLDYQALKVRIAQLKEEAEILEQRIISVKGATSDERVQGGAIIPISAKIASLADKKRKLEQLQETCEAKLVEIEEALMEVADKFGCVYSNILHFKFVNQMPIVEICVEMGYSYPQMVRKYVGALVHYYEVTQEA